MADEIYKVKMGEYIIQAGDGKFEVKIGKLENKTKGMFGKGKQTTQRNEGKICVALNGAYTKKDLQMIILAINDTLKERQVYINEGQEE